MSGISTSDLINKKAMSPDDFHDCIPRIAEVANDYLEIPKDLGLRLHQQAADLLLSPTMLDECAAALTLGNLVLQGPPGTGKSSLARALAKAFNVNLLAVTAHEDWSTFEVIGRQELRINKLGKEEIVPINGHFTEAVIQCANTIVAQQDHQEKSQATWLLIDELNRAHPDKAFGELFSVLGADSPVEITLAYQNAKNNLFIVPRRFRIIATINSIDKQFVNSLSQGLRRRFTFLTIDIPSKRNVGEVWGNTSVEASIASQEFSKVCDEATQRVANMLAKSILELREFIKIDLVRTTIQMVFDLVEKVRYADEESPYPFIPIGTAPLIDTIELFLIRAVGKGLAISDVLVDLDWSVSVKLAPLFDAGMVNRDKLVELAKNLSKPFNQYTRQALLSIASDGLFYIG